MLTVHHLNNSRSQRVLWLLEELGVPYEVVRYERDPSTMLAPPALLAVHPLGKSPVITDGDLTVAESGAIVEYLVATYGEGRLIPPAGSPERLRYTYWLHYAEGSAMPPLLLKLIFDRVATAKMPWPLSAMARRIAGWFTGLQFTAADVQMSFPLEAAKARAGLDAGRPRLFGFIERIHARDAYQRALARGGAYAY
jgi:glutathione S-transferase